MFLFCLKKKVLKNFIYLFFFVVVIFLQKKETLLSQHTYKNIYVFFLYNKNKIFFMLLEMKKNCYIELHIIKTKINKYLKKI